MASKKGNYTARLENDIERCREEGRWRNVFELLEQLKQDPSKYGSVADLLLGEGKMEMYFEDNPPIDANVGKARKGLTEARAHLMSVISEGKKAQAYFDANLLLGKLSYACGLYDQACTYYNCAELDKLTEKQFTLRELKVLAESYAINALCLEKVPSSSSSKFILAEKKERISKCFELATDLTLLYLQKRDRQLANSITGSHSPTQDQERQVGHILETALKSAPIIHIHAGNLQQAVNRYRSMLTAEETSATQNLRLVLSKQLAEVLLRGLRGVLYVPPSVNKDKTSKWKPKTYFNKFNFFVPKVDQEEIVLLLMVAEEVAVKNTVLSQAVEFQENRRAALDSVKAIYDLLAIAVVRWHQASLLNEVLERAMKFSFLETHVWTQRALCLLVMGRFFHSLAVLKQVKSLAPDQTYPCLLGARICYEFLERPREGCEWSAEALERETANPHQLMSRCWLYRGIGFHLQAQSTGLKDEKETLQNRAAEAFNRAQQADPNDHLIEYYLALHLACQGLASDAISHARVALSLHGEHAASLQLLALLQTAQKQFDEAEALLDLAHSDYPDNLHIMYIKAHLELAQNNASAALVTAQRMLAVWKQEYEDQTLSDQSDMSDRRSETRSTFQLYTSEMSDKDTGSLRAQSIAASRVEHALSEVASSISSFTPRPGPQRAWLLQVQIWLLLSEVYVKLGEFSSAIACVHEASLIFPLSHQVLFMRGFIHEHKGELKEALQWYQNAAAVSPGHIRSLQQLGNTYLRLGNHQLAEKTLRDAIKLDPRAHRSWFLLGLVLEAAEEHQAAADSMISALEVETASPVLPYTFIPLPFE